MSFSGKATYTAGSDLPEIAEDVADLVTILSPSETPLLDALGDSMHAATSTRHEWLEDSLLANSDAINESSINDASLNVTAITVNNGSVFRVGDLVQAAGSTEVMLVTGVSGNVITVTRGYGSTTKTELENTLGLSILGNAAIEGQDADSPRFSVRTRQSNYTQIFSAALQISGTEMAVRQLAVEDELDYQKTLRLRELLRDLENTVINGVAPAANPEGSATVRRSLRGIVASIVSNVMTPGAGLIPGDDELTEAHVNAALRTIWEASGNRPDLILCGGAQKRLINGFIQTNQRFSPVNEQFKNLVSVYESDYGVSRVILSRYVPPDALIFLDSTKTAVVPLVGRSFGYLPLATTGDYTSGELVGEYTMELRCEQGHGILRGLTP